jgi:hypothetical protein
VSESKESSEEEEDSSSDDECKATPSKYGVSLEKYGKDKSISASSEDEEAAAMTSKSI